MSQGQGKSDGTEFGRFMLRKAETATATAESNYASVKLDLAHIRERLAEVESQHEPMAKVQDSVGFSERQKILAIAFYVVVGRFPAQAKDES